MCEYGVNRSRQSARQIGDHLLAERRYPICVQLQRFIRKIHSAIKCINERPFNVPVWGWVCHVPMGTKV